MTALPDWVFENFLTRPWPGSWLAGGAFDRFTTGLSIGLSLCASGLFILDERRRRLGRPFSARATRAVCVALSVLSFFTYFDFFNPNTRFHDYYHRHEFYHYYLGSKYFGEIGYDRLYTCTAIAEVEAGHAEEVKRSRICDLGGTNLVIPIEDSYVFSDPARCKRHFSSARWQEFRKDVEWFASVSRRDGEYWPRMRIDHGYNPPPVWTMTGKLLSSLAPAGDHFFKLLALLDILLQLGALLAIRWAFGLRIMTLAAVFWGCNAAANNHFTLGAFLRQDWHFLFVLSVCFARKRWHALSGAALTWSTALRVFPVIAFAGAGLVILLDVLHTRRLRRAHRNFILGSALAGAALFGASSAVTGVDAYRAFADHIRLHKDTPLTNNMGVEMLLAHTWEGRLVFNTDERLDDTVQPWKEGHLARAHALRPLLLAISALELLWMAWVLRRTRVLWAGIALSMPLMMSLLNLTNYYYCMFVALAPLVVLSPALGPAFLALAAASQVILTRFYWIDDEYAAMSLLFYAFALCTLYALSRPVRGWRELRGMFARGGR